MGLAVPVGAFALVCFSSSLATAGHGLPPDLVLGDGDVLDRVDTAVQAEVSEDLRVLQVQVESTYTPAVDLDGVSIVFPADRYRLPPDGMRPSHEPEVWVRGQDTGGFDRASVFVDDRRCAGRSTRLRDGGSVLECSGPVKKGSPVAIRIDATLDVPERYGPFGVRGRQLTLAAGWYPYPARPGAAPPRGQHRIRVSVPRDLIAIVGRRYFPDDDDLAGKTRLVEDAQQDVAQVPLLLLPASMRPTPLAGGRALYFSRRVVAARTHDPAPDAFLEVLEAVADGLRFWGEEGHVLPDASRPLLIVETALRHDLSRATDGPVLVSDRAFRVFPLARFYRFHRFPLLRELFTVLVFDQLRLRHSGELAVFTADALAAALVDRYVAARFREREDAFDVLSPFSFIPSVDSMLYAPDLPFVAAYFRVIREEDPLRENLLDYPLDLPRGKVLYEKLVDRIGYVAAQRVIDQVLSGRSLREAALDALGSGPEAAAFFSTWIGPYPDVRYRLQSWSSNEIDARACGRSPCYRADVSLAREGAEIAEPVEVLLRGDDDEERLVVSPATRDAERAVTATMSSALSLVVLDPHGRLAETPSEDDVSPRFDNRSSPEWKVLLNNFNILFSATEGSIDTALDLGLSRVHDLSWRYGVRAAYAPEAISLIGRATYGFGRPVTPARLLHWVGASVASEYLRPEFAQSMESGLALSGALSYGFDDRQSVWAPETGRSVRLSLDYSHVFGQGSQVPPEEAALTQDAVALSVRALEQWRFYASHQLSLRGSLGAYVLGRPRSQLLYPIGGRHAVRGYPIDAAVGRMRGLLGGEWLHRLLSDIDVDGFAVAWASRVDGALYADVAVLGDDLEAFGDRPILADVGYGLRVYLDYLGVRPGVLAVDIAFPLVGVGGVRAGAPAVYIDFAQSFAAF